MPDAETKRVPALRKPSETVLARIIEASVAVKKDVGQELVKDQVNGYAGYKYASIDQFYEKVATIAHEYGLNWVINTSNFRPLAGLKEMVVDVRVDLLFLYNGKGYHIQGFKAFEMPMPIQGAQTSGTANSYADKVFMRDFFKLPTGEEDADATDNRDPHKRARQQRGREAARSMEETYQRAAPSERFYKQPGASGYPQAPARNRGPSAAPEMPPHMEHIPDSAYADVYDTPESLDDPDRRIRDRVGESVETMRDKKRKSDHEFADKMVRDIDVCVTEIALEAVWKRAGAAGRVAYLKSEQPDIYQRILNAAKARRRLIQAKSGSPRSSSGGPPSRGYSPSPRNTTSTIQPNRKASPAPFAT